MNGGFTREDLLVADGHKIGAPASITYSIVISRDSVRIVFLIVSFNDLDFCACNIGKANHNAKCREKLWTVAGT